AVPGRDELDSLLDEILARPRRRRRLEAQIDEEFVSAKAVLVLDMTGFSRTTQERGLVEFLLKIRRLRRVADRVVADPRGDVVKAEGATLSASSEAPAEPVSAARTIMPARP